MLVVDIKCFHRNDPRRKVKMGVTVNPDIRAINQWKVEELIAFISFKQFNGLLTSQMLNVEA